MSQLTDRQQLIASLFSEMLGADVTVGVDDNFFLLGGHSVLAVRLINSIRSRVGVDIPMRAVFESPTPAELAARLDDTRPARAALVRRRQDK